MLFHQFLIGLRRKWHVGNLTEDKPLRLIIYGPCREKPVFGASDNMSFKPASSATETS